MLNWRLFRQTQDVFGLDVGFETLKVVELRNGVTPSLFGASDFPLPERILEKDGFKNKEVAARIIKEACQKGSPNKITATKIVSALPETFVFSKTIQIPKMTPEEYAEAVPTEVAEFLPIPLDDVYLDYQQLVVHPDESIVDLMVVATPKRLVNEFVEVAKLAGYELIALETKPIAVGRALIAANKNQGQMIVEVGTEISRISIWDGNKIRLSTTVGVGKNQIIPAVTTIQANNPLREEFLLPLIEEITATNRYHQNRDYQAKPIEQILLCGSGAVVKEIATFIEEKTKIKTIIPALRLQGKNQLGPEFTTAYGLALRNELE